MAEDLLTRDCYFGTSILRGRCESDRRETLRDGWLADMRAPWSITFTVPNKKTKEEPTVSVWMRGFSFDITETEPIKKTVCVRLRIPVWRGEVRRPWSPHLVSGCDGLQDGTGKGGRGGSVSVPKGLSLQFRLGKGGCLPVISFW